MNLENTVKFHSPKSPQFTDSPRATASEALTGTDVMGAFGMVQSRSPLGFTAFSGKMDLSENDKRKAIQLLTQHGLKHCDKVAALRKLETKIKGKVVQTLATFAFASWSRSAATPGARCKDCHGTGRACDRERTEASGVFTEKECNRCSGNGYSKLPGRAVYRGVAYALSADQWKRGVSQFYDSLITELDKSESHANSMLRLVTTSFE
ncbi:antitermination protein [Tatumella punctata]|uniref:Antitermination protein n=1 Tax=Tatumella punctata TaxID=399969 RepID=A0ABW1VPR8_9GAMM